MIQQHMLTFKTHLCYFNGGFKLELFVKITHLFVNNYILKREDIFL